MRFWNKNQKCPKKALKMYVKVLIMLRNIKFYDLEDILGQNSLKKAPKIAFQVPNFGTSDDKNAIKSIFQAFLRVRKTMGGFSIDIWEKSNFFGSFRCKMEPQLQFSLGGGV